MNNNQLSNATSSNKPNTIVLRDSDGSTRLSSIILKGANYVKKNVSPELLTNGYLYMTNTAYNSYAMFRNIASESSTHLHLSLDIGNNSNNDCGDSSEHSDSSTSHHHHHSNNRLNKSFSIRTIDSSNIVRTNISIVNNKVGINTDAPREMLDVCGNTNISGGLNIGGTIRTTLLDGFVRSTTRGVLYSGGQYIMGSDISANTITGDKIAPNAITSDKLASNIVLNGVPTCPTASPSGNPNAIANISYVNSLLAGVERLTICNIFSSTTPIVFDFSMYIIETNRQVELPINKSNGYSVTFINISGSAFILTSAVNAIFNMFYYPDGTQRAEIGTNRQVVLRYIVSSANAGFWMMSYS